MAPLRSSLEEYLPSSIEYMLPHYTLLDADGQTDDRVRLFFPPFPPRADPRVSLPPQYPPPPLNASSLARLPFNGRGSFLSVAEEHNPQPDLEGCEAQYLHGPDWAGDGNGHKPGEPGGRREIDVPVYAFHVDKGAGVVVRCVALGRAARGFRLGLRNFIAQDLFYWTFYPFNLGKQVGPLGILGNRA